MAWLSQKEFAELVGLSPRQLRYYADETDDPIPSRMDGRERKYGPPALEWLRKRWEQDVRSEYATSTREDLELEKLKHQAREAKVRADLAEQLSVPVEEYLAEWEECFGAIRTEIVRMPARYGDMVNAEDPGQGEDDLERVADELLEAISEALAPPVDLVALGDGEGAPDAAA